MGFVSIRPYHCSFVHSCRALLYAKMHSSFVWVFTAFAVVQVALGTPFPQGVSRTSRCGSAFSLTCQGSSYGNCCSQYGYCGSTSDHCSKGCQSGYGTCSSSPSTPTAPKVSKDGKCGGDSGAICVGSKYGNCCRYVLNFQDNQSSC